MVGSVEFAEKRRFDNVLSEKQIHDILSKVFEQTEYKFIGCEVKPATDGLAGFLADHYRVVLEAVVEDCVKKIHLFVKTVPEGNQAKTDFVNEHKFFKREYLMFKLFEELRGMDGPNPWCTNLFTSDETFLVMPDLAVEGYTMRPRLETWDLPHVLVTLSSVARYHAAFANYETRRSIGRYRPYNILQEYGHIIEESTFQDTPWLRAAAKLTTNILKAFSEKFKETIPDLESKLVRLYVEACDSLKDYEDTLNVVIHKDLWANNVMFKYEKDVPTNALLIDFQCVRYAPPVFDVMSFLYLNTSRSFRRQHEEKVLHHYYRIFEESLEDCTKQRLIKLNYDFEAFLKWCEKGRMFGILEAVGILPYTLMDSKRSQEVFDDPETYHKYTHEDRTEPVVGYARECNVYRERQLEVSEEFVDRYVLKQLG